MPEYTFTGAYPRVLAGLSQGVNARLERQPDPTEPPFGPPYGSTIEAQPGDVIETDAPYPHPELEEIVPADPAAEPAPAPVADPAPAPAPADPAPDTMTAEGAPAPAEPTA